MEKLKAQLKHTTFLCGISYIAAWKLLLQMCKKFKNGNRAIACKIFVFKILVGILNFASTIVQFSSLFLAMNE
jgi:hypothetical protein